MSAAGRRLAGIAFAAALLLSACTAPAPRSALPPLAQPPGQHQQRREAVLALQAAWSMQGRVALSNGRDGGSGRIDWRQEGDHYEVSLSAPVTRQSWRISGDDAHARLEGLGDGPLEGDDPSALLHEATRWDIPVTALASWVRGARADAARHGEAHLAFGADGRLAALEQAGWTVHYSAWQAGTGVELPGRLDATRGSAKLRLVVDAWDAGATDDGDARPSP